MNKLIYVDNAATTRINDEVLSAMLPFLKENYGNPSSIYSIARKSKIAVEKAREQVAVAIGANPREIYFTGSGTESDNWAIRLAAKIQKNKSKNHIITSNFEHHAVLHTCKYLEKNGFEVTYLPVNEEGYINKEQVENAIKDNTGLVTIMYANNEIGTIQPISEIGALCREKNILFHTDAVQAVGAIDINVHDANIDLLSLSGHKINGPKGVGALFVRSGIPVNNLIHGGAQERNKRGGTENVASIVGLGLAIQVATANIEEKSKKISAIRDKLIEEITSNIKCTKINGGMNRLPSNLNISFKGIEGEGLLLLLDMNSICASSGSACTSGSLDPSHVLLAIGLPHETAHGSLRLSLNQETTLDDVKIIVDTLKKSVKTLRAMSPIWNEEENK